jgi:hypothetical protein
MKVGIMLRKLGSIIEPTTSANRIFLPANSCTANA